MGRTDVTGSGGPPIKRHVTVPITPQERAALNRHAARKAVAREIAAGRLVRGPCERCGQESTPREPSHAHHFNGYAKEARLDIVWLCSPCHHYEHARLNRIARGLY
jgi:hypothetical protein